MMRICTRNHMIHIDSHTCTHANCVERGDSLSFKMVPCLWTSVKNWRPQELFKNLLQIMNSEPCVNHWESLRTTENHWELLKNHQESSQINFRVFCESLRITPNKFQFFCESTRIIENHWESPQINSSFLQIIRNHWESLRIAPNKFQSFSQIIENHQESLQINFRAFYESSRIIEHHWELPRINFRVCHKSLRITENHPK